MKIPSSQPNDPTVPSSKKRVLITYGWNRMSYIINKSLHNQGYQTFVVSTAWMTINRLSRYTYKNLIISSFAKNPDRYIDHIIAICKTNDISIWIPSHEESFVASAYKTRLNDNGIKILCPSLSILKVAHKKNSSGAIAESIGVPTPRSCFPLTHEEAFDFFNATPKPVVLKLTQSNGASGVFYLNSSDELAPFLGSIRHWILQEYVDGIGYGVSCLFSESGQLIAQFTHERLAEKLVSGGTSIYRQSAKLPLIEEHAIRLLRHLQWQGVAMVEFKVNPDTGQVWFIEINPRFWGSLALPYYSGVDFPYLLCQLIEGKTPSPVLEYRVGVKVGWILGAGIRLVIAGLNRKSRFNPFTMRCDFYDDFSWEDPFALLGEGLYYLKKMITSGGVNSDEPVFFNIDVL